MTTVIMKRSDFKGIIAGMMLGDGCISLSGGKNAFVRIQHTKNQRDYLLHKSEFLKELTDVLEYEIKPSGLKNPYTQFAVKTRRHPFYTRCREIMYPSGKKVVNTTWLSWLDDQGLAIWYMDDGCLVKSYRHNKGGNRIIYRRELFLNTCGFTLEQNQLLISFLKERFGVNFQMKLTSKKTGYYRLKACASEANKFIEIVKPFIVPSMEYKLDMQYQS